MIKLFYLSAFSILMGSGLLLAQQSSAAADKVLTVVADVPMPGPAVRFDYQTFDPMSGRLYIAHMNVT